MNTDTVEEWELYPDDHYDGAEEMTRRGRVEFLTICFGKDYAKEEE